MSRNRGSGSGPFLMEMVIAAGFFMLCVAVCVSAFVMADHLSRVGQDVNHGVLAAESLVERVKVGNTGDFGTYEPDEAFGTVFENWKTKDPEAKAVYQYIKDGGEVRNYQILWDKEWNSYPDTKELEKNGKTQQLYSIPDEYLPDRIISYCSGANSSMEDILIRSPRASLASDLYDLSLAMDVENGEGPVSGKEEHPGESSVARGEAAEEILSFYERLDVNPRVLFLDAVTSKFILPALFAVMPFDMQDDRISEKALRYATLRKKLLKRLNIRLIPAAFSLRIDDTRLEEAADRPQMSILRRLLSQDVKGKALSNCVIHRTSTDRLEEDGSLAGETAAVFLFESWEAEGEKVFYHPMLQRYFDGSPFALISTLLTAWREGVIREIHFSYRNGDERGLYEMEDLSDGELMWLARIGLILMAQNHCGENTLFLYDEPDVHFNDDWSRDFVRFVYAMCSMDGTSGNEFLVATHSDLILTDAMRSQIHLFENPTGSRTEVKELEISTFAAGRDSISKQVFKASSIGGFASDTIKELMAETDPEQLAQAISKIGPGYQRFRLQEQLYALLEKNDRIKG